MELTRQTCSGGIVIVPLNFWCSIRKADVALRADFLNKYKVSRINVFEERVFEDTSYTVCSFQFSSREDNSDPLLEIPIIIFPSMTELLAELNVSNSYFIGGDIYKLPVKSRYRISRLTSKNKDCVGRTLLRAKCIDDSAAKCIALELVAESDVYVDTTPGQTARTYASLSIVPAIDVETQKIVAVRFNELLNEHRIKFRSLFMANFRESKDVARKRISFDLVYRITEHILDALDAEVA